MKKSLLIISCFVSLSSFSIAQDLSLKQTFNAYLTEVSQLNERKDLQRVLQYFDEDCYFTESYIGLTGRQKREEGFMPEYIRSLKALLSDQTIELNLRADNITVLSEDNYYGVISANLTADVVVDGRKLEKNSFNTTMTAIKGSENKWRFIESDVIRTLEERKAGNCVCYFYERKDDFVTEVIYPNGFDFRRILDDFKFRTGEDDQRIIKSGYRQFSWAEDGRLQEIYEEGNQPVLGTAQDKKSAVLSILSSFYSDECVDIIVRN